MNVDLVQVFQWSLRPDGDSIKKSERILNECSSDPAFLENIVNLYGKPDVDLDVLIASTTYLKNWIKRHWSRHNDAETEKKDELKKVLIRLTLEAPEGALYKQLLQATQIISDHDFPCRWMNLLDDPCDVVESKYSAMYRPLQIIEAILQKYEYAQRSSECGSVEEEEVIVIMSVIDMPILSIFTHSVSCIKGRSPDAVTELTPMDYWWKVFNVVTRIYYVLHQIDLPDFFEKNIQVFFTAFIEVLGTIQGMQFEGMLTFGHDELHAEPSIYEKAAHNIISCIRLYAARFTPEFFKYELQETCTNSIMALLARCKMASSNAVIAEGFRYLSAVVREAGYAAFLGPYIENICKHITFPAMLLRGHDLEMIEDDPKEYIRDEIDGFGGNRRNAARSFINELLNGPICQNVGGKSAVMEILTSGVSELLADSSNEVRYESGITLACSMSILNFHPRFGVSTVNMDVNLVSILRSHIIGVLRPNQKSVIIPAAALKFAYTFRNQWDDQVLIDIFSTCSRMFIEERNEFLKSYCAMALTHLLSSRKSNRCEIMAIYNGELRLAMHDNVVPIAREVLYDVIKAVEVANNDDNEQYLGLLKQILTTFDLRLGEDVIVRVTQTLLKVLSDLSKSNPNAIFVHILFETFVQLVNIYKSASDEAVGQIEKQFFPTLAGIVAVPGHDFNSYIYQLMASFIDAQSHSSNVPTEHSDLFGFCVDEKQWNQGPGNLNGILRLLRSYVDLYPKYKIIIDTHFEKLIHVLKYALRNGNLENMSAALILSCIQCFEGEMRSRVVAAGVFTLVDIIGEAPTSKNVRASISFFACYAVISGMSGGTSLREVISLYNNGTPGIYGNIIKQVILPHFKLPNSKTNARDVQLTLMWLLTALSETGVPPNEREDLVECLRLILTNLLRKDKKMRVRNPVMDKSLEEAVPDENSMRIIKDSNIRYVDISNTKIGDFKDAVLRQVQPHLKDIVLKADGVCNDLTSWGFIRDNLNSVLF